VREVWHTIQNVYTLEYPRGSMPPAANDPAARERLRSAESASIEARIGELLRRPPHQRN
jgi:hypothetical protein